MTKFCKHLDRGMKSLGAEAIQLALDDAGIEKSVIQAAWMANAAGGLITGQECIGGQVILRGMGIGTIPVINIENACASASTAFEQAAAMVTAGLYDIVLAVGTEKLYHEDKVKTFSAFGSAVDVEAFAEIMANLTKRAEASGAKAPSVDGAGTGGGVTERAGVDGGGGGVGGPPRRQVRRARGGGVAGRNPAG